VGDLVSNRCGKWGKFEVQYAPSLPTNLFPLELLQKEATSGIIHVGPRAQDGIELILPGDVKLTGRYTGGVLVLDTAEAFVATVSANEARFDRRQLIAARQARRLQEILGFPPTTDLLSAARHGFLLDIGVTTQDIARSEAIYGPSDHALAGRMTNTKTTPMQFVNGTKETALQRIYSDVFFVDGCAFLGCVLKPLDLLIIVDIADSTKYTNADLADAIQEACRIVTDHGFTAEMLYFDGEAKGLKVPTPLDVSGANDHVPIMERAVRTIKERVTALRDSLPYRVSRQLVKYLVRYVGICLNLFPSLSDADKRSPRERFTGVKPTLRSFRELAFGDYCMVPAQITPGQRRATTHAHSVGAIAVAPTFNSRGSWLFVSLDTGNVIRRSTWKLLPTPADVIARINAYSLSPAARSELPRVNASPPALRGATYGNRYSELATDVDDDAGATDIAEASPEQAAALAPITADPVGVAVSSGIGLISLEEDDVPATSSSATNAAELGTSELDDDENDDLQPDHAPEELAAPPLRRSDRVRLRQANHASLTTALEQFGDAGKVAAVNEIKQMMAKGVFSIMEPSARVRYIPSHLFLKEKRDSSGRVTKLKGRLVAGGHRQPHQDVEDVSSPTVSVEGLLTVLAVSAAKGHHFATVDVEGAFLECSMDEDIFMRLAPDVCALLIEDDPKHRKSLRPDGSIVVQLKKALYGTKQASRLWYTKLSGVLLDHGFQMNLYDKCVFRKCHKGDNIVLTLHVDDGLISSPSHRGIEYCVSVFQNSFAAVNVQYGPTVEYLGMRIERDDKGVRVTMPGYSAECVQVFTDHDDTVGKATSPGDAKLFDIDEASATLPPDKTEAFKSIVAKVLFLATRVRPDLLATVSFLSSRVKCSTVEDWSKLRRLIAYISVTLQHGLFYRTGERVALTAYIDASHGIHAWDGTGRTGIVITVAGGAVCSKSCKQNVVTLSSTESELVALTEGTNYVLWLRNLLDDLGIAGSGATTVYQDNLSTLALVSNDKTKQQRTRHLNCKYFAVRERVKDGAIALKHLPGSEMLADVLTKSVDGSTLRRLLPGMMYVSGA
jgi:hypothetical protein